MKKIDLINAYEKVIKTLRAKPETIRNYVKVLSHVQSFPYTEEIGQKWIEEFSHYLDSLVSHNSKIAYLTNAKTVLSTLGIQIKLKMHYKYDSIRYLSDSNLLKVENHVPKNKMEEKVKDLFLFSAYTSVCFSDLYHLTFDEGWIVGKRTKTELSFQLPITPKAQDILTKYNYHLPQITLCYINRILKRIHPDLTFHMARHTFATHTLDRGVSMEVISSVMGHSNLSTTQKYAKVRRARISKEFEAIL
jgi:integrase